MAAKSANPTERRKKDMTAKPQRTADVLPANGDGSSGSKKELLRQLYRSMLKCRMLGERAQRMVSSGDSTADCDFAAGDEAIVAGAALELGTEDTVVASPHNLAARSVRGERPLAAARSSGERTTVATAGIFGSFDPFNLGTGIALAHRLENTRSVVVALSAAGASTPDHWREGMKLAGTRKLPIIYVLKCSSAFETGAENVPSLEEISFMARGCGFPAVIVDGHDAVAVWRVSQESIHRARNRGGPTLIECDVRFTQYADPLAHMEHYMKKRDAWNDEWRREATEALEAELETATPGD